MTLKHARMYNYQCFPSHQNLKNYMRGLSAGFSKAATGRQSAPPVEDGGHGPELQEQDLQAHELDTEPFSGNGRGEVHSVRRIGFKILFLRLGIRGPVAFFFL